MKIIQTFILISITIFFTACSYNNIKVADIKNYPQTPSFYIKNFQNNSLNKDQLSTSFIKKYFSPWYLKRIRHSKKDVTWGNIYANRDVYSGNHRQIDKELFKNLINNSNFEEYNKEKLKALTTKNCDFKVFPTNRKIFYNPKKAGEGYPFDYNQNSRVKINTPVFVSHFSKDKAWAFVQSHYVLGWVRVDNLLFLNNNQIKRFQEAKLNVIIKEGYQNFAKNLTEELKIGTFFPKENNKYLVATNSGIKKVALNKQTIKEFPLDFNSTNIQSILNEFINEPYGWGGLNNLRDCSSFTQDFFTPFGVYLNRNSRAQRANHKYIDISKLNSNSKKKFIIKNGIPFLTLIYLRGHIMLYLGEIDNEPIVMHNMWGVRTWEFPFEQGRNIVGKTVITTLEPGKELKNVDRTKTILKKVKGIILLNQ